LYLAVSEPSYYIQDDGSREYGPDSVLLIKESSLDKISFLDGGRLSFYYPPNRLWPLEKRTDQKKYTIHSKEYLDGDLNQKDSIRKIGCIPKVDKEQKPYGLGRIGQKCNSDYTCASLCCKHRRCAGHNPSMGAYCSKSVGQSCVSRNYCAKQIYESCYIVKTGKRPGGEVTCALRCYQNRIFPRCRNSRCTRVDKPPVPAFNPANPDCSEAIDPPLL